MSYMNCVGFRGNGGTETTGSVAQKNNPPVSIPEQGTDSVKFRGSGTETTGSIAQNNPPINIPEQQPDTICFHGSGSESTGSIAHRNNPCPTCGKDTVSFKANEEVEKKGVSTWGVIGGILAVTALTIGGLGYAHKSKAFEKLGDGWMKKTIGKLEPAGAKCHEWCSTVKNKSSEYWAKFKGWFSSKKS